MAWNLINEPRATGAGDGAVAAWVGAVAPAVKKLFPRQLLTVGEEGFYGPGDGAARRGVNPRSAGAWAEGEGQVRKKGGPYEPYGGPYERRESGGVGGG
jgi:hypothetical protein